MSPCRTVHSWGTRYGARYATPRYPHRRDRDRTGGLAPHRVRPARGRLILREGTDHRRVAGWRLPRTTPAPGPGGPPARADPHAAGVPAGRRGDRPGPPPPYVTAR